MACRFHPCHLQCIFIHTFSMNLKIYRVTHWFFFLLFFSSFSFFLLMLLLFKNRTILWPGWCGLVQRSPNFLASGPVFPRTGETGGGALASFTCSPLHSCNGLGGGRPGGLDRRRGSESYPGGRIPNRSRTAIGPWLRCLGTPGLGD